MLANVICISVCFAKDKSSKEVEEPVSNEQKINKSEAIVYAGTNSRYSPINTERPGFVQEEYDKINNYNIDLHLFLLRIQRCNQFRYLLCV